MTQPTIEHLVTTCQLGDIGAPSETHVFVAPFPCRLAAGGLVTTNDVMESEESFLEVSLIGRRFGDERQIVTKTTKVETGEEISAGTYWHFDVCEWDREARHLATGAVVSLRVRPGGRETGDQDDRPAVPALTGVLVALRHEPT
ncbi:hypothetical protein [Actinopolymorpha sp. B9G3]|uniref:hypothetical protein n=1 Tax=Actinopolymorpha sp. B9G3 TaxID=3158970 RepID=UPI0032D8F33E